MKRWRDLTVALAAVAALAFAAKHYTGPAAAWFNDSLAGVFYVVFWCLLAVALRPRWPPLGIALGVLLLTSVLEALQLWKPPPLQAARDTFLGRALLGTTFQASDFLYYVLGATGGWRWALRFSVPRDPDPDADPPPS